MKIGFTELSLTPQHLEPLKLARYEIHLRTLAKAVLPPFLGSALRGAFGHALKAIACSMPHGDCSRCMLVERCLYPRLFETAALNGREWPSRGTTLRNTKSVPPCALHPGPVRLLKKHQDAPRPFIFIPPLPAAGSGFLRATHDLLRWRVRVKPGERMVFGLSLFGNAIDDLPYIIYAISLMAQHGFGAARASFALEKVFVLDAQGNRKLVYTEGSNQVEEHEASQSNLGALVRARLAELQIAGYSAAENAFALAAGSSMVATISNLTSHNESIGSSIGNWQSSIGNQLTLRFITPTRLRTKGRLVERPSFAQLVSSLSLRLSMLAETWGDAPLSYDYKGMLERANEVTTIDSSLRLMALNRYSNRRGAKLELDGFMGEATFRGAAIPDFLPLLVAGEFLHVGSGTAFGLGRYVVAE